MTAEQEMAAADPLAGDCDEEEDLATGPGREPLEEPNPVLKLERYAHSDVVFNRQLGARNIVDTLRTVMNCQDDVDSVLSLLSSLSLDCEPSVRMELIEQLPHIAVFCASEAGLLENVVRDHVVPIIVQYLTDVTNQVRKRTQVSLLFILERALLDRKQLEEQICTVVMLLTENEKVGDSRIEAVTLMAKMAPFLGQETTAALFLPRFTRLCQDSSFHVRKVCASHFGDFFSIVGQAHTEDHLSVFKKLCEDCVWGVRKACAEVFMPVSCMCSLAARRSSLAPLFLGLLDDQSRWVRIAAFQALGPFISTFADPERTGLYYSPTAGVISVRSRPRSSDAGAEGNQPSVTAPAVSLPVVVVQEGLKETATALPHTALQRNTSQAHSDEVPAVDEEVNLLSQKEQQGKCEDDKGESWPANCGLTAVKSSDEDAALPLKDEPEDLVLDCTGPATGSTTTDQPFGCDAQPLEHILGGLEDPGENTDTKKCVSGEGDRQRLVLNVDSSADSNFNTFQFWRVPIPEVEVDIEFIGGRATAVHATAKPQDQDKRCFSSDVNAEVLAPDNDNRMSKMTEAEGIASAVFSTSPNSISDSLSPHDQDIVPVQLLERYQTMIDPSLTQNVDSEIGRHCARSLPAVALTLGRLYWPCLRTTYQALVSDVQWKVRHTVASCLHELAVILGPQIASQDLVPSFRGFVRDVDEVRVGLLERLGHFLRSLSKGDQRRSLPLLADFLSTDNRHNWRFRHTLARQLCELAELYDPLDINQYLVPIASELLRDEAAEVRHKCVDCASALLRRMASQPVIHKQFVRDLCARAHDQKWAQRQLFCRLVEEMAHQDVMTRDEFLVIALPKLLELCDDSVPNVRMALAHCLATIVLRKVQLWHLDVFYQDQVKAAVDYLKEDVDRDVRYNSHLTPREDPQPQERIE